MHWLTCLDDATAGLTLSEFAKTRDFFTGQ
jgi:hypothetical protein